jgi:tetratricopeptide (TPR) repeat protein
MGSTTESAVDAGRDAFEHHQWQEAFERLSAADSQNGLKAEDMERLGEAARWSKHWDEMLGAFERAGSRFEQASDKRGAARVAIKLAMEHFMRHNDAVAGGLMARAASLLDGEEESREYGRLLWMQAGDRLDAGDLAGAQSVLADALELAERLGDRDLLGLVRMDLGNAILLEGRAAEAMSMFDEIAASALSGELEPWTSGRIFCSTIFACRSRGDWGRAGEWSEASLRWCERHSLSGFPGLCRFHLAEVLRMQGKLDEAEQAAQEATDELAVAVPRFIGFGHGEIGEIRRRRGDLDGAAEAFDAATDSGWDPQPGLSMLRLDQGRTEDAKRLVAHALADPSFFPREGRPLVLPAAVTIGIAAGDLDFARDALSRLESLAENYGTEAVEASACVARGEIALAESNAEAATRELRQGVELWSRVEAPYEVAQARLRLAEAYRESGDADAAESEMRVARAAFDRMGAQVAREPA